MKSQILSLRRLIPSIALAAALAVPVLTPGTGEAWWRGGWHGGWGWHRWVSRLG